jgi:hypothetical protein
MKKGIIFLLFIFFWCCSLAQPPAGREINITVQSDNKMVLHSAIVTLMKEDSSVLRMATTDKSGIAEFKRLAAGKYIIRVSHTGYQTAYSSSVNLEKEAIFVATINLNPDAEVDQCGSWYQQCRVYYHGCAGTIAGNYSWQRWQYQYERQTPGNGFD